MKLYFNLKPPEDNIKIELNVRCVTVRSESSGSRQIPVVGSCGHGNEPSRFIKGGQLLGQEKFS
jgi:hypothetical protein